MKRDWWAHDVVGFLIIVFTILMILVVVFATAMSQREVRKEQRVCEAKGGVLVDDTCITREATL